MTDDNDDGPDTGADIYHCDNCGIWAEASNFEFSPVAMCCNCNGTDISGYDLVSRGATNG